jgi:4-aminobutyrate aminotransferase-like enzyme
VIDTVTHGKIAAFIAEPILGVGGFIDPPKEYFKRAHEIIKSYGGLYISDEVQTGIGRTGEGFFGIEAVGVRPDFISCAKGLGNGAPIGAVIAKGSHADTLGGKLHFNTFGGDPYQSMQAAETIDIVLEEGLIQNAKKVGGRLKEGAQALQKDFPIIGDVRGRGLMVGLEFVKDPRTKEPAPQEAVRILNLAKDEGLLVGKGGLRGNVIRLAPPLSINAEECEEVLTRFRKILQKV